MHMHAHKATCGSSLASRRHQRSPACLIGYRDSARTKMARRISPLDLHSPAFRAFRLTPGTHLAAIIYLPLLSPHITVTLPSYALTNKVCPIVRMRSFFFSNAMMHPKPFSLCPADWKSLSFLFFLPSCFLLSACVSNREHAHSQIQQCEELTKEQEIKTRETKLSFRATSNTSPYSANTHDSKGAKD